MTRPMSAAAATQPWSRIKLRCQSCGDITLHSYPGKKPQRALRRLAAEAMRSACAKCQAKNWKPA